MNEEIEQITKQVEDIDNLLEHTIEEISTSPDKKTLDENYDFFLKSFSRKKRLITKLNKLEVKAWKDRKKIIKSYFKRRRNKEFDSVLLSSVMFFPSASRPSGYLFHCCFDDQSRQKSDPGQGCLQGHRAGVRYRKWNDPTHLYEGYEPRIHRGFCTRAGTDGIVREWEGWKWIKMGIWTGGR